MLQRTSMCVAGLRTDNTDGWSIVGCVLAAIGCSHGTHGTGYGRRHGHVDAGQ